MSILAEQLEGFIGRVKLMEIQNAADRKRLLECQQQLGDAERVIGVLSKEYHQAINEPEYAGTRQDWIDRAFEAELKLDEEREKNKRLQNLIQEIRGALGWSSIKGDQSIIWQKVLEAEKLASE